MNDRRLDVDCLSDRDQTLKKMVSATLFDFENKEKSIIIFAILEFLFNYI